jgi:hypothetical protein
MSRTVGRTGVMVTEEVVNEVRPAVKTVVRAGKKGVSKAKAETLKVAKTLKEEGD